MTEHTKENHPTWHAGYVKGTFHRANRRASGRRTRQRYAQINHLADLGETPEAIKAAVCADSPGEEAVAAHEVNLIMGARQRVERECVPAAIDRVKERLQPGAPYVRGDTESQMDTAFKVLTGVRVLQPSGAQVAVTQNQTINNDNRQAAIYALSTPQGRQAYEALARALESQSGGACGENESGVMEAGEAPEPDLGKADRGRG